MTISGQDSKDLINTCGEACGGVITRTYTATDACGNTTTCTQTITYGTPSTEQIQTIAKLLEAGDLTVGEPGVRSLTIPGGANAKASAFCLVAKLSAGGAASALSESGDLRLDPNTCQTSPALNVQKDGTWNNVALSQAISLALNLRMSTQQQQERMRQQAQNAIAEFIRPNRLDAVYDLSNLTLSSTIWTQGALSGADGVLGTSDDELDLSSARTQIALPTSVTNSLGSAATVPDLMKLANSALAGHSTGEVNIAEITAAMDAINRSFDFGKRRILMNNAKSAK